MFTEGSNGLTAGCLTVAASRDVPLCGVAGSNGSVSPHNY